MMKNKDNLPYRVELIVEETITCKKNIKSIDIWLIKERINHKEK